MATSTGTVLKSSPSETAPNPASSCAVICLEQSRFSRWQAATSGVNCSPAPRAVKGVSEAFPLPRCFLQPGKAGQAQAGGGCQPPAQMESRFGRASGKRRLGRRESHPVVGGRQEGTCPSDAARGVTDVPPWPGGRRDAVQTEVLGSALTSGFQGRVRRFWRPAEASHPARSISQPWLVLMAETFAVLRQGRG